MRIRNVNKNWDWTFGQSQSNYVRNEYAVILDIQMKLKEWYGDCFFALQNGINWRVRLGSHNQQNLLDKDVINVIQGVNGVLNIFDFSSTVNNRKYIATCNIYTEFTNEPIPLTINSEDFIK